MPSVVGACIAALACVALVVGITVLVKKRRSLSWSRKVALGVGCTIALLAVIMMAYFADYYHASDTARQSLTSTPSVNVMETQRGYLFDGPGRNEKSVVFYPGVKVEEVAYAPLMQMVAERGVDCFLLHMPFNLALFGRGAAAQLADQYEYDEWYLAGHSLGGVVACSAAPSLGERAAGVIALALIPRQTSARS